EMNDYEGGVTLVPTYMQAGISGTCMVPETGWISVDVRAKNVGLLEKTDDIMKNLPSATSGIRLEIKGGIDKPPLEGDIGLFETARKLGAEVGIEVSGVISGGGSDGNFTAAAGVPTIDGLGMSGLELHNMGEYINIDHIARRTTMLARMIQTI
ncbi:M20/M25/M40 family metallo-hydrolase, partial [Candidatus Nomurabacteria bacterium]|nr:M20/M25/M40 family metallo-hydrolase [Candidatus Nomurabacteria bacterium]